MNKTVRTISLILLILCITMGMLFISSACFHPGFLLNIGNNFPETVTVYFNGHDMGKLSSGETKNFWPDEITQVGDLLLEMKSNNNTVLFAERYSWKDLENISSVLHANAYSIGEEGAPNICNPATTVTTTITKDYPLYTSIPDITITTYSPTTKTITKTLTTTSLAPFQPVTTEYNCVPSVTITSTYTISIITLADTTHTKTSSPTATFITTITVTKTTP